MALYEPGLGYYRRGVRPVGRTGDFFTSVSVGPLYGRLLAEQARQVWEAMGRPEAFTLIEQGAHDGTLMRDILSACRSHEPEFFARLRGVIIEPDAVLREAQQRTLAEFPQVAWVESWSRLPAAPAAFFLCNELVDAFPAHRLRWTGEAWAELHVVADAAGGDGFRFVEGPLSHPQLRAKASLLATTYPAGYTTDICLEGEKWMAALVAAPFSGAALIMDYGLPEEEYFAPERSMGTLRRYFRHQVDDRVLEDLGEADLTTDVNFTALAQAAGGLGLELAGFIEQGRHLTRLFAGLLARNPQPMDAAMRRQFHTLAHPGFMGRKFHALLLAKDVPAAMFAPAPEQEAARRRLGL